MAVSTSAVGFFLPIFAFLFVFIVVYTMLSKTKILGESQFVMLFISFILASFFIVQASLVEFVRFTSAWFSVGVVALFFLLVILAFLPKGEKEPSFLEGKAWFGYVIFGLIVLFFIFSAGYVFDLALNFDSVGNFLNKDWVGGILLLVIAIVVSMKIKKDSK